VIEYLNSNVVMLKWMISEGYGDARTMERRIARMEEWLANPHLMEADADAEYTEIIEINMDEIKEPILALPNDPDASALLSEVAGAKIDEVFIGSCMTNIGHFRAAGKLLAGRSTAKLPTKLWVAPPTKMDAAQLTAEGYYSTFGTAGARMEMPGCSLCMGNQARVDPGCTVVSTSTRNFPNRLGQGANVYLASAELAAVASIEGRLPTVEEYMKYAGKLDATATDTYRYLNFDELPDYVEASDKVEISAEMKEAAKKLSLM
jgi:aconitate hydratase 2/2-methylisocitrate dehydratase